MERGQDAEGEEEVEDEAEVCHQTGDEAVEGAHENHEQNQGDDERGEAVVDGLLTQRRADYHVGDDVDLCFHLTGLEDVGKVLAFLDGKVAGDFGAAAVDGAVDVGRGVYHAVEDDGNGTAYVGAGDAGPVACALRVHHHVYTDAAAERVLVLVGGCVHNHFAVKGSLAVGGAEGVEGIAELAHFLAVVVVFHFGLDTPAQCEVVGEEGLGLLAAYDVVDLAHLLLVSGKADDVDLLSGMLEHCGQGSGVEAAVALGDKLLQVTGDGGSVVCLIELEVGRALEQRAHTLVVLYAGELEKNLTVLAFEHLDVGADDTELVDTFAEGLGGRGLDHAVDLAADLVAGRVDVRAVLDDVVAENGREVGVGVKLAVFGQEGADVVVAERRIGGHGLLCVGQCLFNVVAGIGHLTEHVGHVHLQDDVHTALKVKTEVDGLLAHILEGVAEINFLFANRVHIVFIGLVVDFVVVAFRHTLGINFRLVLVFVVHERERQVERAHQNQEDGYDAGEYAAQNSFALHELEMGFVIGF